MGFNPKFISRDSDRRPSPVAAEDSAANHQSHGTPIIEQHGPIDQNLDELTHVKNYVGV
jgi:hypothetical protein